MNAQNEMGADRLREINTQLTEALRTLLYAVEGYRVTEGDCNEARAALQAAGEVA
jgi:hypothetical protein